MRGGEPGRDFSVARGGKFGYIVALGFPRSIRRGGMALARSALYRLATVACFGALALTLTACSTFSGAARADSALKVVGPPLTIEAALPGDADLASVPSAAAPEHDATLVAAAPADTATDAAPRSPEPAADTSAREDGMAQAREMPTDMEPEEYDPWERWNEPMFDFNRRLDKYVLKPIAKGYNFVVRDGIGKAVDTFLDPLAYFLPFIWDRLGMKVGDIVNERSLNLDLFQGFEESVIDMYSAVRHAYLQCRERLCRE